jgi:hypothetical protein
MEGYVLAAFRSRTQTMAFYDRLKRVGCMAVVVNTPKEAHVGCGVSAEFSQNNLNLAKTVVGSGRFSSFVGFFLIEKRGSHTTTARI